MLLTFLFLSSTVLDAANANYTALVNSYQKIEAISLRDYPVTTDRAKLLLKKYYELIDPLQHKLLQMNAKEAAILFRTADLVSFYADEKDLVDDMEADIALLDDNNESLDRYYKDLYGAFLETRQFKKAGDFYSIHSRLGLEKVPAIVGTKPEHGPAVLRIHPPENSLVWDPAPIKPVQVVVVAHPECHFTQNAVRYIENHPALASALNKNSMWIAPPARQLDVQAISRWNELHPGESMALASSQSDWPMISSWETPAFYFLKDGRLKKTVIGWPEKGNAGNLVDGLREIGLDVR